MGVVEAAGIVAVIVEFFKVKFIPNQWVTLPSAWKTVLSVLACLGVTAYKYLAEGLSFNFGAVTFFIQVVIAVVGGYELVKGMANTAGLRAAGK